MEGTSSKKESKIKVYLHRYFIDAMSAMAQGLFASLLIGTIISTLGTQLNIPLLDEIGGYAKSAAGPAMAVAIGYALQAPPLVLFSLVAVGGAANTLGGAGGPLAVLVLAIIAAELGKLVSKKTKVDIIVTPLVTIFSGCGLAYLFAPYIGTAASSVGNLIMWATTQQPFLMGILVSVIVGVTNVIPFFGPFIGAIPSFILILLMSPMQSVYFLIFVLVLQQFDGNILGPRILGDSTGLSSFWVLFSILLFGGLFGFVGMIVAVPIWAVILNFVQRVSSHLLRKKGLPTDAADYISGDELTRFKE